MAEVWKLDLPQNEKFVLLAFGDHADDEGITFPSIGRIAWKTGYTSRQVQVIAGRLRECGLLETISKTQAGRSMPTVYRVCPERGVKTSPFLSRRVKPDAVRGEVALQLGVKPASSESSVTIIEPAIQKSFQTEFPKTTPEDTPDWQ